MNECIVILCIRFVNVMKVFHYALLLCVVSLTSCNSNQLRDPVWHLDLDGTEEQIMAQLKSDPEVRPYLYSFQKKLRWEGAVPTHVNCRLTQFGFQHGQLKSLRYTISVDSKSARPYDFNVSFYEFFQRECISTFGNPTEKWEQPGRFFLQWNLENNLVFTVDVSKEFNNYLIEYRK